MPGHIDIPLDITSGSLREYSGENLLVAVSRALEESDRQHHSQRKPYSIWPLLRSDHDARILLRIGWASHLRPPTVLLRKGRRWRFGGLIATAGEAVFEHVEVASLRSSTPTTEVALSFVSPTLFKRRGAGGRGPDRRHPIPDGELTFRGLIEKWNVFACAAPHDDRAGQEDHVPADVSSALLSQVEVKQAFIRTEPLPMIINDAARPDRGFKEWTGFVGDVTFGLTPRADVKTRSWLAVLGAFATYAGVGYATTHGFGAVVATPREADVPATIDPAVPALRSAPDLARTGGPSV